MDGWRERLRQIFGAAVLVGCTQAFADGSTSTEPFFG